MLWLVITILSLIYSKPMITIYNHYMQLSGYITYTYSNETAYFFIFALTWDRAKGDVLSLCAKFC